MPGLTTGKNWFIDSEMCFSASVPKNSSDHQKITLQVSDEFYSPILPGLPDDVAKQCLALVRKLCGKLEEWLYVLTGDADGKGRHWEILGCLDHERQLLPAMPGPEKSGFGVVVLDGKLLVLAGYFVLEETACLSSDVYQYDSCLNKWSTLAPMNVARYDFACAEVNGRIYVVGGCGSNGESLSSAEVYDPEKNEWALIESIRRPRWGCFACGFEGKIYVMGGRSSFTIGNSRFVDVYDPECHTWSEMKNGCVMVTAHAVLQKKLFCMEWKNQRKVTIFDPVDKSWKMVPVPLTGSSSVGFKFGILNEKLLLFSAGNEPGYQTMLYDPKASPGSEWKTSDIKPSGLCLCSMTITA
ncbi:F-box/kelch-repeat protein [Thalictrum thalictroides]|uniref:F-box/kelch-repeat protein n=1 Tax=Thalictrum thalictroides TaxID=46969 RepID=A0A7J6W135_THATH|nr:F-box/kelch-repeat protein [Thalictrum thalictroides]